MSMVSLRNLFYTFMIMHSVWDVLTVEWVTLQCALTMNNICLCHAISIFLQTDIPYGCEDVELSEVEMCTCSTDFCNSAVRPVQDLIMPGILCISIILFQRLLLFHWIDLWDFILDTQKSSLLGIFKTLALSIQYISATLTKSLFCPSPISRRSFEHCLFLTAHKTTLLI